MSNPQLPIVTVVNLRTFRGRVQRCDRSTPLGNPCVMKDEADRDFVCDWYHQYFYHNLNPDIAPSGFLEQLDHLIQMAKREPVMLGCWCAPKRCHCDTIKGYIEQEVRKDLSGP